MRDLRWHLKTKRSRRDFGCCRPMAAPLFLIVAWLGFVATGQTVVGQDSADALVTDRNHLQREQAENPASPTLNVEVADAAERKAFDEVQRLVTAGADVNGPQADGMTALHWAVLHDDVSLARWLVTHQANPNLATRYQITPLYLACANGSDTMVTLLLEAGADLQAKAAGDESLLMTAARTGRTGPVRSLLARKLPTDEPDARGQTALMWAAAEGHLEVVSELLAAGADPQQSVRSGFTPLLFAAREGKTAVVQRLLQADLRTPGETTRLYLKRHALRDGTGPLLLAIENGHFETARELLAAGADPNDQATGYAPLHAMTWVRKPIRGDGDPPPIGSGKLTSLDMVRLLVEHGATLDARQRRGESGRGRFTSTGSTPFLLAARASDLSLMKLLVELGADAQATNVDGCTPLLAAAGVGALGDGDESAGTELEAFEAVRYLLDQGADINAVDVHGETAMHGAAYQSRSDLVLELAKRGASPAIWNRANAWGWTPLMIAQGHRPGNFRPAPQTIEAIERCLSTR